jgi:hypothetical protein
MSTAKIHTPVLVQMKLVAHHVVQTNLAVYKVQRVLQTPFTLFGSWGDTVRRAELNDLRANVLK